MKGKIGAGLLAGLIASLLAPAIAPADHHAISIREVSAGAVAADDYVVLQMYAAGQTQVLNRQLILYNPDGSEQGRTTLGGNVANGENQRTILIGGNNLAATRDFPLGFSIGAVFPKGALCFDTLFVGFDDCVSWGGYEHPLLDGGGSPLPILSQGVAFRRDISAGCATLLERSDDTDSSVADFDQVDRAPRGNRAPVVEQPCSATNPDPTEPAPDPTDPDPTGPGPDPGNLQACNDAKDALAGAKAKLKKAKKRLAQAKIDADDEAIERLEKKVKRLKRKVRKLKAAVAELCA